MSKIGLEETGELVEAPRYQSKKVVQAAPIIEYNTAQIRVDLGDGKVGIVAVEPDMFARYTPVAGDMVVIYDNADGTEYASISPRAPFDAGYDAVVESAAKPLPTEAAPGADAVGGQGAGKAQP